MKPSQTRCSECGAEDLIGGSIVGFQPTRFVPDKVKTVLTYNGGVDTACHACLNCGAVTVRVDVNALARLVGREPAAAGAPAT